MAARDWTSNQRLEWRQQHLFRFLRLTCCPIQLVLETCSVRKPQQIDARHGCFPGFVCEAIVARLLSSRLGPTARNPDPLSEVACQLALNGEISLDFSSAKLRVESQNTFLGQLLDKSSQVSLSPFDKLVRV